jgi:hypothetical protein
MESYEERLVWKTFTPRKGPLLLILIGRLVRESTPLGSASGSSRRPLLLVESEHPVREVQRIRKKVSGTFIALPCFGSGARWQERMWLAAALLVQFSAVGEGLVGRQSFIACFLRAEPDLRSYISDDSVSREPVRT